MSSSTPADPLIGATVSQYEIVAKLGGGGMGVVYRARDLKLGRHVALKFLPPQWSHDEGAKQRFMREAQAASATNHKNICTIHNIEETADGRLFIVMAFYEGETLKQRLERGALPIAEAIEIGADIAEGLAKAHAQGVVHRDVKPGNVIVTDDGAKILDFGLAKFADALQLTVPGSTIGTVAYMSPEQTRGEEADARSDVWALGVVMFEMLGGRVPFAGAYPEATFYAIKHEPVPSLRALRPDVPDALERTVMKALEKEVEQRFQTAREPARELRLLQGRTMPLDLRTEPVPSPVGGRRELPSRRSRVGRRRAFAGIAAMALILIAVAGAGVLWIAGPPPRTLVAIAPVINQTGFAELDPYRLALTQTLLAELAESPLVRVVPYNRLRQIVDGLQTRGLDLTSRETLQAVTARTDARFIVVPTLLYENSAWRARAEIRSAENATTVASYETAPFVSSLAKDRAYDLMTGLAVVVQRHFDVNRPGLARLVDGVRLLGRTRAAPMLPRLHTLDAADAFQAGLSAYDELRYADAQRSFASASEKDPQSPLAFAWLAHTSQILQQSTAARQAADQALKMTSDNTPLVDRLFVAAVVAEAGREYPAAEARYRELIALRPDEPDWLMQLGALQYRRSAWVETVATYRAALKADPRMVRAHLELCRAYNRLNEGANAKEEGEAALGAYRELTNRGGEGQALMCLTDMLRVGNDEQRVEATRHAESALAIFTARKDLYNLARAQYYLALATESRGQLPGAIRAYEASLNLARQSGNVVLEPLLLMNVGVAQFRLGHYASALDYYQQSKSAFERAGDEQRAAQNMANVSAILIEFAGQPDEGLRDLQNARAVFERLSDKNWELFAAKVTAAAHRYAGRQDDAERELHRAIALAKGWDMTREIPALTIDLALSRLERSDYGSARMLLTDAIGDGSGRDGAYAQILLALAEMGRGQMEAARIALSQAASGVEERGAAELLPELQVALGEHARDDTRIRDARTHFAAASALWQDDLPNPASVAARAELAVLDRLDGRPSARLAADSLAKAREIGQLSLIARCRIALARIHLSDRRFRDAIELTTVTQADRSLGPELLGKLHYWQSEALLAEGDAAKADQERRAAQELIRTVATMLPEPDRASYRARPDIQPIRP